MKQSKVKKGRFIMKVAASMFVIVTAVIFMFLVGCASTSSKWGADSTSGLKGKTEAQIISEFGKPYRKFTTSGGVKVLEYRQSAQEGGALNTLAKVGSFGIMSGESSAYVDMMKIYLKEGRVAKATFEENVQGVTTPGL